MKSLINTFTIFGGDMRFIYIGPIVIIIEWKDEDSYIPKEIEIGWDKEIWESLW